MYNLSHFKDKDHTAVIAFMQQHPFAMVIGTDAEHKPSATQVPVLLKQRDGTWYIQAHIMRQSDHHKAFVAHPDVLVVFSGAHTYVSASLYENKQQASTWNYMSVHARGVLRFFDDNELLVLLEELTAQYEQHPNSPASYKNLPEEYITRLSKAIIGFEIKVYSLEHVFKLSQNRDESSYDHIMKHLQNGDQDQQIISSEMQKRKDQLFGGH